MDKWSELRKAVEELSEETSELRPDGGRKYAFLKALTWVLNRMNYLDEQEKKERDG